MVVQDSADSGDSRLGVRLQPFLHQVGGHLSVMTYDEHTVCKPLISREHRFYEALPPAMKRFTPQYKGTITVHLHKDSRGRLSLVAHPLKESREPFKVSPESAAVAKRHPRRRQHTQWAPSPAESHSLAKLHTHPQVSSLVLEDANGNQVEARSFNPWGLHCHQAHLTRLCSEYPENQRHRILATCRKACRARAGERAMSAAGMGKGTGEAGGEETSVEIVWRLKPGAQKKAGPSQGKQTGSTQG